MHFNSKGGPFSLHHPYLFLSNSTHLPHIAPQNTILDRKQIQNWIIRNQSHPINGNRHSKTFASTFPRIPMGFRKKIIYERASLNDDFVFIHFSATERSDGLRKSKKQKYVLIEKCGRRTKTEPYSLQRCVKTLCCTFRCCVSNLKFRYEMHLLMKSQMFRLCSWVERIEKKSWKSYQMCNRWKFWTIFQRKLTHFSR